MPPCPGDEGIAIGCATFGWHQRHALVPSATADFSPRQEDVTEAKGHNGQPQDGTVNWEEDVDRHGVLGRERRQEVEQKRVALAEKLRTPFWGKQWSSEDIEDELEEWESFVDFRELEDLQVYLILHKRYPSWWTRLVLAFLASRAPVSEPSCHSMTCLRCPKICNPDGYWIDSGS